VSFDLKYRGSDRICDSQLKIEIALAAVDVNVNAPALLLATLRHANFLGLKV
jgi:hypothetical protein